MRRYGWWVVLALALLAAPAAAAMRAYTGVAPSGAWYRIKVPDGWRAGDALVLYQHGFELDVPSNPPGLGPLEDVMLAEGYAVAATSFSRRGWALFTAIGDNRELLDVFAAKVGAAPGTVIPFGGSMGGLVALRLAESRRLPPMPGAYALCPAAAGARLWDAAVDLRLAWDVVCSGAGELPRGDEPLPWAVNFAQIPDDLGNLADDGAVAGALVALNRCTGVNLPPYLRNDAMQRRLDRLMAFTHISDEHFFVTNVGYASFVLGEIVRAPDKLGARNPFTTVGVDYGSDADIDARIPRIAADPSAAAALRAASDFRGAVGGTRVLSMHTSRDQLVIPGNQDFVRALIAPAQRVSAIVDEDAPTHCGFSEGEGLAGWETLRSWMAGAAQPAVADLQRACEGYVAQGLVDGPCRFDPDAEVVPFDDIVRPRPNAAIAPPVHSTRASPHRPPQPTPPAGRLRPVEP